jgi:nicotinate-nucleotide--dimethylbenzimidazole phosphoribosyltransferase
VKLLKETCATIVSTDAASAAAAQALLDDKTKPRRSLGRLEDIAVRIAAIRGTAEPVLGAKAIVVMGADHGVAAEGVSAYPAEVTAQMLLNFASGGAAINVLSRAAGARVVVYDMGVASELPPTDSIRSHKIAAGTRNMAVGPAMTEAEAVRALETGITAASELIDDGVGLIGTGEMGIANTTASSALTAVLAGADPREVTGRGTGIDDVVWKHKVEVIRRAIEVNDPHPSNPLDVLAKLGGFEIAGLAGVVLGAASRRVPVVIDGFISSVAALVAARMAPDVSGYLLASHRSVEVGHRLVLQELGTLPLLDLDLRLGEGTGAALAMGLVDAALAIVHEMATFSSAGVSDTGA